MMNWELGAAAQKLSGSGAPLCLDEHSRKRYNILYLFQLIEEEASE